MQPMIVSVQVNGVYIRSDKFEAKRGWHYTRMFSGRDIFAILGRHFNGADRIDVVITTEDGDYGQETDRAPEPAP